MKKILLLFALSLVLTGCTQTSLSKWFSGFFGSSSNVGSEFVVDNNAVFDLFQDDFGVGTEYDDIFIDGGNGDVGVGDTGVSATGQVEYEVDSSYTFDPVYTEVGKMTPEELHGKEVLEIPVLMLGGNFFPFPDKQFGDKAKADLCDHTHYHGDTGYTLDLEIVPEPSNPCGFDDATKIMRVSGDEMIDWFHNRPRNF